MLSLNEQEKEYLFILGFCYLQQQKYPRAEVIFRALYLIFPQDLLAIKCLAYVLFASSKKVEAEQLFAELIKLKANKRDKVWANFMRLLLQARKPAPPLKPKEGQLHEPV